MQLLLDALFQVWLGEGCLDGDLLLVQVDADALFAVEAFCCGCFRLQDLQLNCFRVLCSNLLGHFQGLFATGSGKS